ncbi:ABC1 kinase family protein [Peribacillus glennii]|uniref:AarF/ABC1/UbiB kinase family protein n=1 Tax=Peribacillus glennii TaxID=2303991 RepID=A0A372LHK8_9BACI|nr:AarF/UbiB family protein [Peribacillus glennii]RFU65474.1 AarF/ABC1/UbiB kinase family protein [Peribacillus glennii]
MESIKSVINPHNADITKANRQRRIVAVVMKHGLGYFLRDASIFRLFRKRNRSPEESEKLRKIGRRMRMAFEELGPTFIKLGQVLVTRNDILPEEITQELENLLDKVPPIHFDYCKYILENELPEGLDTFEWIDPDPIGSASLAQVYRARLKTGDEVAVKVLRPTVEKLFQTDISVIKKWTGRLQKQLPVEMAASLDLNELVADYYSGSMNELNLEREARTMDSHRQKAGERFEWLRVTEVYHATKNVMVMEFVDGWTIKDFPVDFYTFEERLQIMLDLAHYYIESYMDGDYHADAHGSNILICKKTRKAVPIDFGMVGKMDTMHTQAIFRFLMHTRLNQAEDAAECAMDVISPTIYTDTVKLRDQYRAMFLNYVNSTQADKYNWGRLVLELINIGMMNYCKIPNGLALWAKAFSAIEGTARWICPEVSYHHVVESADTAVMKGVIGRRFNYRANATWITEFVKLFGTMPRRINKILEHFYYNDFRMNMQMRVDKRTANMANQIINRLALTMIISSIIIATGLIMSNMPEVEFFGLTKQAVASTGLMLGLIMGVFLLWRIWRT